MRYLILFLLIFLSLNNKLFAQEISPFLFGQNHWIATGDERNRVGYINQLWPKVEESGITCIRIGGNGYNHNLPERNRLTAMIDSIRKIGAEPLLQVPDDFTGDQTRELVEFYTQSNNRKVNFWSIGNEPLLHDDFTIEQIHDYILRIATAIKKADAESKVFVFDECELRENAYRDLCGGRLDITGLKENGAWLIDGFTFHRYPNGREFDRDNVIFSGPENVFRQSKLLTQIMDEANEKHNRTGDEKLLWGLTEVNVTYANPDREISGYGNTSFLGGQFMAEVYGIGMQFGAFSVNPWCISETDAISTDFGYLGLPREFYPRSSYYHTQMMANNMKGQFLSTTNNQKYIKTVGSINDEQICILVLNEDQNMNYDFEIVLNRNEKSDKPLTIFADTDINKRISGRIENQTSIMFIFDRDGKLKKKITYGLKQNLKYQKPEIEEVK